MEDSCYSCPRMLVTSHIHLRCQKCYCKMFKNKQFFIKLVWIYTIFYLLWMCINDSAWIPKHKCATMLLCYLNHCYLVYWLKSLFTCLLILHALLPELWNIKLCVYQIAVHEARLSILTFWCDCSKPEWKKLFQTRVCVMFNVISWLYQKSSETISLCYWIMIV